MFIALLITWIVAGLVCTGIVFASVKVLRSYVTKSVTRGAADIGTDIRKLDLAIQDAVASFEGMVSLDEITVCDEEKKKIDEDLSQERQRLTRKEKELERAQAGVDQQEQRHSELKKGHEGADDLATTIADRKQRLDAECSQLNQELEQSKQQLEALAKEAARSLDTDQKHALQGITTTLTKSLEQLKEMSEIYELSSGRFHALQKQYVELEKEYRRLVDREISGAI